MTIQDIIELIIAIPITAIVIVGVVGLFLYLISHEGI